ncbi:hypothetical protein EQG49_12715 [Periweissella cryptocerci]|uniref:Replication terminator protein n=1 Tax=Periweissella cryptocerci TaxID=2506420 RepID=A0A4P6YWP0_9LACO|nr:hypothetical protein [Periweissella cryptocerci]QBO37260.1 hypothetical protein EQG49_12715 [Periweissella cryptocerci]
MSNKININVYELNDGAFGETINAELSKLFANILDQNTDQDKARKLNIMLTVKRSKEFKDEYIVFADTKLTLQPVTGQVTKVLAGRDYNTGRIEANELRSGVKGQTYFDTKDERLKTDVGEDIEDVEATVSDEKNLPAPKDNLIDLRKKG